MNILSLEHERVIVCEAVGVTSYDFNFELHFECSHPYIFDDEQPCVLRIGPIEDYAAIYAQMQALGLRPVNSPEQHLRASELAEWYPLIEALTPRTRIFDALPDVASIESQFRWPVFLKGSRQTSKHNPDLAVIQNADHYRIAAQRYLADPILHWQRPVIREFVPLWPVGGQVPGKVRSSMEYRSFWWQGSCLGWGRYWHQVEPYDCPDVELGLAVAEQVAKRLRVPFLVVDFAKTADRRWIVIECNDAQESGYTGVSPRQLWRRYLEHGEACPAGWTGG